ncbi:DUF6250 domain-containing protein [Brevundimonas sp. TWP2-3-4b1]|uniref:DUF6250 domain-containing protein n=1 Tax=Brevundimonas sp. TWP2-3-4b1 TaxID=2804580 RepID=UPI003CE8AD44
MRRFPTLFGLLSAMTAMAMTSCATPDVNTVRTAGLRLVPGTLLHSDDFRAGLSQWAVELERGGRVEAEDGTLDIDVPAGATIWFRTELRGPVMIEYQAELVDRGGPHDRVSDLNAFWMASDPHRPDGRPYARSGALVDYDTLLTYYVGQGGNGNTTTRMRRYLGEAGNRFLLPEHDRSDLASLLQPSQIQTLRFIAAGSIVQYWRDGILIFEMDDTLPIDAAGSRCAQHRVICESGTFVCSTWRHDDRCQNFLRPRFRGHRRWPSPGYSCDQRGDRGG